MKKFLYCWVFFLSACNPNLTVLDPEFHPTDRGWGSHEPVWRDEFNGPGTALDAANWVVARFCGGHNAEEQCYTDRPSNIHVDPNAGHLIITARDESLLGKCDGDDIAAVDNPSANEVGSIVACPAGDALKADYDYSSARIHTRIFPQGGLRAWTYGRVEIRAKLPGGTGTWPAFWMMPVQNTDGGWPASGEIDIMEAVNLHSPHLAPDAIQSNIHLCTPAWDSNYVKDTAALADAVQNCSALNVGTDSFGPAYREMRMNLPPVPAWQPSQPDLVAQFHTYSMEWSDMAMGFYVDNQLVGYAFHGEDHHHRAPFRHGFYLIINLAIGGNWPTANGQTPVNSGDWLPNPGNAELVIDWVRVYTCVPNPLAHARPCIYNNVGLGEAP